MPYRYVALLQSTYELGGNNSADTYNGVGQLFLLIAATIFVMILAYYSTKWLAGVRNIRRGNSNLKVIEGVSVGYQNNVQLLKVGEKYIVIGVTKDKITFLTELDANDINTSEENQNLVSIPFEKYLNKYFKTSKDK